MSKETDEQQVLFDLQVSRLGYAHHLVLYWCTQCEGMNIKYNITNCFDDLKHCGVTRTKQTAVSVVETLYVLGYVDMRGERNRKNIYITTWGAKALRHVILSGHFEVKASLYLEDSQS